MEGGGGTRGRAGKGEVCVMGLEGMNTPGNIHHVIHDVCFGEFVNELYAELICCTSQPGAREAIDQAG